MPGLCSETELHLQSLLCVLKKKSSCFLLQIIFDKLIVRVRVTNHLVQTQKMGLMVLSRWQSSEN